MRALWVLPLAALCSGCVTGETVRFNARAQQEAMMRDGNPALVSRKKNSLVLVRPAARQFASGGRPVFVVAAYNLGRNPIDFRVSDVDVVQVVNQQSASLKVITFDELMTEERNRQIFAAVVTGLAAGANAAAASQQGRYSSNSTVHTSRGTYQVHTTGYSPTANAIAQANASAQNEAMISSTIEQGQRNMASLERGVIKDNTLLPGEWYGGQLHISPPTQVEGAKQYSIALMIGGERHEIDVTQDRSR